MLDEVPGDLDRAPCAGLRSVGAGRDLGGRSAALGVVRAHQLELRPARDAFCRADRAHRGLRDLVAARAYSVLDIRDRDVNGRGLIGFNQPDEPDEHGGADSLVALPPSSRSGRISMLTLTNHFFSAASPLPDGRAMYPQLVKGAEF